MIERTLSPQEQVEDHRLKWRPPDFKSFIGQKKMKATMGVYLQAAKERRECIDHVLLCGPPGLGKTTFAYIIASEMGGNLKATSAPVIEKTGDMAAILSSLKEGDLLFIDEIHRLKPVIEEILYSAMEDYFIDIQLGQGMTAKSIKVTLPFFTLVGATTRPGALSQPFLSRFGIVEQFQFYEIADLMKILEDNAEKLETDIEVEGSQEIAKRSRGTPRILNRLLKRVRDFAQVNGEKKIDKKIVDFALNKMEIDTLGLDNQDRKLLGILIRHFSGGPVGLENLATSMSEDTITIEDMIEPYLIQIGLLKRSPRGRVATHRAYEYLNIECPRGLKENLDLFSMGEDKSRD